MREWFEQLIGRLKLHQRKNKTTTKRKIKLSKSIFFGRAYGYSWVLLEKRDPNFNGEELKKRDMDVVIIKATTVANEHEIAVVNELLDRVANDSTKLDELEVIKGALEGKLIEYCHLEPTLLLEDKEIKG